MNNPIDELDDCVNVSDPTHMVDMVDMVDMVEGNLAFSSLQFLRSTLRVPRPYFFLYLSLA